MPDLSRTTPGWVDRILDWKWTWLIARTMIVSIFLVSGVSKLLDFPGAIAEQAAHGLQPAAFWAAATIAVQLIGSVLVISRRFLWIGAGALGVFTASAALLAHDFWNMAGAERFASMNVFLEHVGLIGGLITTALVARLASRPGHP